jgi:hypothetical protein
VESEAAYASGRANLNGGVFMAFVHGERVATPNYLLYGILLYSKFAV